MTKSEWLIAFQNKAERDFEASKSIKNTFFFILAIAVFFASTLYAAFTLPFRVLWKYGTKKPAYTNIIKMTDENFQHLIKQDELLLVDFWAEWCGPCVMMNKIIEYFATKATKVQVAKVNADANREIMKKFKVKGLPTFLLICQGIEVKRHAGPMILNDLQNFIEK